MDTPRPLDPSASPATPPPPAPDAAGPTDPIQALLHELAVMREFVAHLISVRIDQLTDSIRRLLLRALVVVTLTLFFGALSISAAVLFVNGVAGGLAVLTGSLWLGNLLGGVILMAAFLVAGWFLLRMRASMSFKFKAKRYAERRVEQRTKVGRDIDGTVRKPVESPVASA